MNDGAEMLLLLLLLLLHEPRQDNLFQRCLRTLYRER